MMNQICFLTENNGWSSVPNNDFYLKTQPIHHIPFYFPYFEYRYSLLIS